MSTSSTSVVSSSSSSVYSISPESGSSTSMPVPAMASGGQALLPEPTHAFSSSSSDLSATAAATQSAFLQSVAGIVSSSTSSSSSSSVSSVSILSSSSSSGASHVHAVSSPLQPQSAPKLSRKEIYRQIGGRICQVKTGKGLATGCCIGKNLIAVPVHVLCIGVEDNGNGTSQIQIYPIECFYDGIPYRADRICHNLDTSASLDCMIFQITDADFPSLSEIEIFNGEVEPGEKVYFGGFPLTQQEATFHSGIVSSVDESSEITLFTIDGTVVPGNSGGPVFIVNKGGLKLVGIVFHQIADFDPAALRTIAILNALSNQNPGGVHHRVTIQTEKGSEQIRISDVEAIALAFDLIQRNLSTGIGKAFHAKHLVDLSQGKQIITPQVLHRGMPVMKGEKIPWQLSSNPAFLDWFHRHVKGQPLCGQLLGTQIEPDGHVTPVQAEILWKYYQAQPHHQGYQGSIREKVITLGKRITQSKPKALKKNREAWLKELSELDLGDDEETRKRVEELIKLLKD